MQMLSYAQNGEDVVLRRVFPEGSRGFYLDVGANDPVEHSVTKHFYEHGWSGVNIEPNRMLHGRLVRDRPRDVNLNIGVSNRADVLTFHEAPKVHGWSTFSDELARSYRDAGIATITHQVPVRTLAEVCDEHCGDRVIDFLKIDVEGLEYDVISGMDWSRRRPRVVLVETNGWERWEPILLEHDYLFALFDGLNRFYARREDEAFLPALRAPANTLDEFIPYGYHRLISQYHDLGPNALAVARRLTNLARRHPLLARGLKTLLRRAG